MEGSYTSARRTNLLIPPLGSLLFSFGPGVLLGGLGIVFLSVFIVPGSAEERFDTHLVNLSDGLKGGSGNVK